MLPIRKVLSKWVCLLENRTDCTHEIHNSHQWATPDVCMMNIVLWIWNIWILLINTLMALLIHNIMLNAFRRNEYSSMITKS